MWILLGQCLQKIELLCIPTSGRTDPRVAQRGSIEIAFIRTTPAPPRPPPGPPGPLQKLFYYKDICFVVPRYKWFFAVL